MTRLNPNPHEQGFSAKPLNGVAGTIDRLKDAVEAVEDLKAADFPEGDIAIFIGADGLTRLEPEGKFHGVLGQIIRASQWIGGEDAANQDAKESLESGRVWITAQTDGTETRQYLASAILKRRGAYNLRLFGALTVDKA